VAAKGDNGGGVCGVTSTRWEVNINMMEGFSLVIATWSRPYRDVSQERYSLYLGFFEFIRNIRERGKTVPQLLLGALPT